MIYLAIWFAVSVVVGVILGHCIHWASGDEEQ
jgi:hypothetical protein